MVKRGGSTILPRFNQNRTQTNEGYISQLFRFSKSAYLLDSIEMESIKPSLIFLFFTTTIFSIQCYLMALAGTFLRSGTILSPLNFLFCITSIFAFLFLSSFCYKKILKRNFPILVYCFISLFSLIYLPIGIFLNNLVPLLSFIFFIGVAMISQYFLSNCLLSGFQFRNNKQQFIFYLCVFIFQYGGIILISFSLGAQN